MNGFKQILFKSRAGQHPLLPAHLDSVFKNLIMTKPSPPKPSPVIRFASYHSHTHSYPHTASFPPLPPSPSLLLPPSLPPRDFLYHCKE